MTTITSLAKIGRAAAADLQPAIQGQVSQGQVFRPVSRVKSSKVRSSRRPTKAIPS